MSMSNRVQNKLCLHTFYDPSKCPINNSLITEYTCHWHHIQRNFDKTDIAECSHCGNQKEVESYPDEDYLF